ncbi:uncharacterized protein [Miscanthus floridulus]|uniref:uncharacterized protein n=1 Tax=Miscanthus floridulus TaxID=154761 RepID=UPI00345A25F7
MPFVAEAPGVSEAEATEAMAPATAKTAVAVVGVSASAEAMMAEARDPETAEAIIAEAGAPKVTKTVVMVARPSVQEAEMQAAAASVVPLVQGPPLVYLISSDDTSRAREVVDAEETNAVEQPAPLLDEGSSALVRVRPEPHGVEVEDLRLRCADAKVEAAAVQAQLAPLAARVKELEEELTYVVSDRDAFRSRAEEATASGKALAGQLGAEESAHRLTKGALNEALAAVEASQIKAMVLKGAVEELGSEASRAAEASRFEAQWLREKAEACQAETRRWEQKAKGELRGLPSPS